MYSRPLDRELGSERKLFFSFSFVREISSLDASRKNSKFLRRGKRYLDLAICSIFSPRINSVTRRPLSPPLPCRTFLFFLSFSHLTFEILSTDKIGEGSPSLPGYLTEEEEDDLFSDRREGRSESGSPRPPCEVTERKSRVGGDSAGVHAGKPVSRFDVPAKKKKKERGQGKGR